MRYNKLKMSHNKARRTITLRIQKRDAWGNRGAPQQITFGEREFFRALREGEIIDWGAVIPR